MADAAQEINGFTSGLQDWEAAHWADEDPTQYADLAEEEPLVLFGSWREPQYVRGYAADEFAHGMRITTQSALTAADNRR